MKLLAFVLVLLGFQQLSAAEFQVEALYEMKQQLIDNSGVLNDWKDNQMSPCYWDHVTCQDNKVTAITLSSSGLKGVLSPSIAKLTALRQLLLDDNSISGTIPQAFGSLSSLTTLNLGRNNFEGAIPNSLCLLQNLEILLLDDNNISGTIPQVFGSLSSLTTLNLGRNNFEGAIPNSLGLLQNLENLDLSQNHLSGVIPNSLSNLSSLNTMDLSKNLLEGCIPISLSNLQSLSYINLAYNRLRCAVPEDLLQVARYNYTGNDLTCGKKLSLCERENTRTGVSKSSNLKVLLLGIFGGAVTLFVIGVLFLLWWQRRNYQAEIYIDIYGKNDQGLKSEQEKQFSWRELLQTKINYLSEQNVLAKGGVGKDWLQRDVEAMSTRRELDQYSVTRPQHTNATSRCLNFQLLTEITKGFSKEHKIGHGAFGEVYMGELSDGEKIAVKKLRHHFIQVDDVQFNNELRILMKVQHPNIVQFVGYCYAIQHEYVQINGKFILAEIHERALCFEYLQNGSLKKHLTEVSCGLDWQTRYKIIKGICEGLNYLHNGSADGHPIYHLDLKPDNILLDENMMPKIADFGLSRLFGTTQSYITENFIGTRGYMPPEYVDVLKISNKFDVFSLGAIIMDIMTGPSSCRFDYAETSSSQDFVKLVQENWKRRLQATPSYISQEADTLKVKTCIDIAFKCLQTERAKRPTIGVVLDTLNYIDTVERSSLVDQVSLVKFGLWGGHGGRRQDIKTAPQRLEWVTIYSGVVIDALEFSYTDCNGEHHTAGPWGSGGTSPNKVQLHPSEFLVELQGTVGPFDGISNVITSLTLVTNAAKYGPFGQGNGTPFHILVQSSGHIAGFFGRANQYVNAVGVYTNQDEAGLAKIGPWGGDGGTPCDIEVVPHRLRTLMIRSADIINSVAFSYSDRNGQQHTAGPWGGPSGEYHEIELDPAEFLVTVSGTSGPFNGMQNIITSLTFVTNAGSSYGPFGRQHGTPFDIPVHSKGCIVGFFGCAGTYLDAIGIYACSI